MAVSPCMDRPLVALALACAVVLAGCGGGPTGTPTPTDGGTPTDTPTPSAADVGFPPGVSEDGVTDVDALLAAHADALESQSATVAVDVVLSVDGQGSNTSFVGEVTPGDDRGLLTVTAADGAATYYTEGDTTYRRLEEGGQTKYDTTDGVSAIPDRPRFGADARARDALSAANWTVDGVVARDGERLIRLAATDVRTPEGVNTSGGTTVSTSGYALVTPDGVVRHVEVSTRVEESDRTVVYGISVDVSAIGTTETERPDWVDRIRD
jgi:hypothetical protein